MNHSEQLLKGQMMANSKRASAIQQTEDLKSVVSGQFVRGWITLRNHSGLPPRSNTKLHPSLSDYVGYPVYFCKYFKVGSLDHI